MTFGQMYDYTQRFNEIMSGKKSLRDIRLANLMTDLEVAFNIPMFKKERFEEENVHLMQFYRTVSEARTF